MRAIKWIGVFFLFWLIGTAIALSLEMALLFSGIYIPNEYFSLVILATIIVGLVRHGMKRKQKGLSV